ncbi:MAG TPA: primosomal protein N' [Pseudonocardia sp.]|nr:primosomal protein N' [Pseudonocardia sp.]
MAAGRNRGEWRPAAELPVARVAVDVALAHLDRPFDYRVPAHLDEAAVPGVRLRVRFAGRLVDGYLLERVAESAHGGTLAWVDKVVSPEPVLTAEVATLCRAVADRYAGVLADVVRLAVPPRHARVEAEPVPAGPGPPAGSAGNGPPVGSAGNGPPVGSPGNGPPVGAAGSGTGPKDPVVPGVPADHGWGRYAHGAALLDALAAGRVAHAVWQALPGESWPARLAEAAAATVGSGQGVLLLVPDQRDVDRLLAACTERLGADRVVALTAELGPAERYRRWLTVRRGRVRVVVGTRSAAFAPVERLGLLAVWDDGDDLHAEPRAPYPHARDVLLLRAHQAGAALLVGGYNRTAEAQLLVGSGWAREVVADRATVRAAMPRVTALGESDGQLARDPDTRGARLPAVAFEAARAALAAGRSVLVQVPRAGYLPWLACAACRETARCRHCAGPLGLPGAGGGAAGAGLPGVGGSATGSPTGLPHCRWCGRAESGFRCAACGSRRLRAGVVGAGRTAEELGRAFPGTTVRLSGGGAPVLAAAPGRAELVVATPGAEPPAPGGYGAALLLDGWALLSRPDLRVAEETLRRWLAAAALVVPHSDGGRVVVMADSADPTVQALVRWDPAGHAAAELAGRAEVGFPPAVRMAAVEGTAAAVADVLAELGVGRSADLPPHPVDNEPAGGGSGLAGLQVLGPVELEPAPTSEPGQPPLDGRERALLRVPRADGRSLAAALHAAQAARTARKVPDPVRIRLDPIEIG